MKNVTFIIVLLLFVGTHLQGQNNKLEHIQTLTISSGLAHNGVTSILEDSRGFYGLPHMMGLIDMTGIN